MRTRTVLLGVALVGILGASVYGGSADATPASGQTTTPIATKISFEPMNVKMHANPASLWGVQLKTRGSTDAFVVEGATATESEFLDALTVGDHVRFTTAGGARHELTNAEPTTTTSSTSSSTSSTTTPAP